MRLGVVLLLLAVPAPARWIRASSPHFELLSDGGESPARQVLARLEQIHAVFGSGTPLPVRVFLIGSESQFRRLRPAETTTGFYQSAPQRDYLVLSTGNNLGRVAFHEYVHLVLNHTSRPLPKWLEEGTAEFFSTLSIHERKLVVGAPVTSHTATLGRSRWMDPDTLATVDRRSPYYSEQNKVGIFYAQSWALVHMLRLSKEYGPRFPVFAQRIQEGAALGTAFSEAFGKPFSGVLTDLAAYVNRNSWPTLEIPLDAAIERPAIDAEELANEAGDLRLAELAADMGLAGEAERLYRQVAKRNPRSAEASLGLGVAALARKDHEEARRLLEAAARAPEGSATAAFEFAMLLRETNADRGEIRTWLEKTVERNPKFAEAHFLLGAMDTSDRRPAEAIPHLQQAVRIFPRQSYFWHALALAYHQLGKLPETRAAAERALEAAETPQQADMASAALRLAVPSPTPQPKKAPVETPASWQDPKADHTVDGTLEYIDCTGSTARIQVRANGRARLFLVEKPGEILLNNTSSLTFEFRCGAQKPRRIVVGYRDQPDPKQSTVGVVTSLEFP